MSFSKRLEGFLSVIAAGIAVVILHAWIRSRKRNALRNLNTRGDEIHNTMYGKDSEIVLHSGSCHCQRLRFSVYAPKTLRAVDFPSKIRYPRLSVPLKFFLHHSSNVNLSFYPIRNIRNEIGVYSFCGICGMHVLYSPCNDTEEIQINVNCLDKSNIENITVAFHSIGDDAVVLKPLVCGSTNLSSINGSPSAESGGSSPQRLSLNRIQPPATLEMEVFPHKIQCEINGLVCTKVSIFQDNDAIASKRHRVLVHSSHQSQCRVSTDSIDSASTLVTWAALGEQTIDSNIPVEINTNVSPHTLSHIISEDEGHNAVPNDTLLSRSPSQTSSLKCGMNDNPARPLASINTLKKHLLHHLPIKSSHSTATSPSDSAPSIVSIPS